jgi:hypothetical protein
MARSSNRGGDRYTVVAIILHRVMALGILALAVMGSVARLRLPTHYGYGTADQMSSAPVRPGRT